MSKEEYIKKHRHNVIIKTITRITIFIMLLELTASLTCAAWFWNHGILMVLIDWLCFGWCEAFCYVNGDKAFERLFRCK